jgi:N-acetylglucosaminyldiphosphoundecaprenol N-acetyl-beta-D-mannosaminyltransferase
MLQSAIATQEVAIKRRPADAGLADHVVVHKGTSSAQPDAEDLSREVYCIFGMPIDAISMPAVLQRVEVAVQKGAPYLISTPNLNFLVQTQLNADFRESVLSSDLCPADGMPIVWLARLLGVPTISRIAGSDIFDALNSPSRAGRPVSIFLFGGQQGAAEAASRSVNSKKGGVNCTGYLFPGFDSVEDMSRDEIITKVNASDADVLVASLGAEKGQAWLMRNHRRLRIPVRAHLGAVMNFEAGTVKRAPTSARAMGIEWLWRIYQEPHLWRRYWRDGRFLLRLMLTQVLPLMFWQRWLGLTERAHNKHFKMAHRQEGESLAVSLAGFATTENADKAALYFRFALSHARPVIIDLSQLRFVDARFIGILLMLRKVLKGQGAVLKFFGASKAVQRLFRLNGVQYLLAEH